MLEEVGGPSETFLFHSLGRLAAVRSGGGGRGGWSSVLAIKLMLHDHLEIIHKTSYNVAIAKAS